MAEVHWEFLNQRTAGWRRQAILDAKSFKEARKTKTLDPGIRKK
jgi:hypothetical protein